VDCRPRQFLIRVDPRDLSRIWVLDPERNVYIEVPFRTLSHPPITKWEHRAALNRLRELGKTQVDEAAIFGAITQMRTITDIATKETRAARRNKNRRSHLEAGSQSVPVAPLPPSDTKQLAATNAKPFDDIEEW
jgi:putative transposase